MGVFHVFQIVQIVPNRATHHIFKNIVRIMLWLNFLYLTTFSCLVSFTVVSRDLTVSYGKEWVCGRDGSIVWFPYFLIHIRPIDVISNHNKINLLCIYMSKVENKNTRTRCETCLKLKLKNKYARTTLPKGVLLSLLLTLKVFLSWF